MRERLKRNPHGLKPEHIRKRAGKIDREGTIGGRGW